MAAVVIAAATVGFVILRAGGDSSNPAATPPSTTGTTSATKSVATKLRAALIPVAASQDAVNASLRAVSASNGSLQQLHSAAVRLSTVVGAGRARLLAMTADRDDQAKLVGARKALAAHGAFAAVMVSLPTSLDALRARPVLRASEAAAKARTTYQELSNELPVAATMNIGAAFEQRLLTLATNQQDRRVQDAELGAYLQRLDSILTVSANGRGDVGSIVESVKRGDTFLQDGANQMSGPIANRQQVLADIAALPPAPESAAPLAARLATAIEASLAADEAYRDWMSNLPYDYDFNTYGDPNNADFQRAQSYSGQASSAKAGFVDLYNARARQFGLRTWSGSQI